MKLKNIVKIFSIGLVAVIVLGCGEESSIETIITTIPVPEPVSVSWCPDLV